MKYQVVLTAVLQFFLYCVYVSAQCPRIAVRKEIRDLSSSELQRLHNAFLRLNQRSSPTETTIWDRFARLHLSAVSSAHGRAEFLPWHRHFIWLLEKQLQNIDPEIALPYWDWSLDSQRPERSIVFSPEYFGGASRSNGTGCLTTGPYARWPLTVPSNRCLERRFNGGTNIAAFTAPEVMSLLIARTPDFATFAKTFEATPHAAPHLNIGGDMSTMHSPNDPLFYLHHAYCDKLWTSFQNKGPSFKNDFGSLDNRTVNADVLLTPFNISVRSVMDIDALCYTYQEPSSIRRTTQVFPRGASESMSESYTQRHGHCPNTEALKGPLAYPLPLAIRRSSHIIVKIDKFFKSLASKEDLFNGDISSSVVFHNNPGPLDRRPLADNKIHLPAFIDSHWLHHMGLNEGEVRKTEIFIMELTDELNNLANFTSIASLERNPVAK